MQYKPARPTVFDSKRHSQVRIELHSEGVITVRDQRVPGLTGQPPEKFARIMSRVPGVMMIALPFKTLWLRARSGHLEAGDPAPDFLLESKDRHSQVQLSSFRGKQPVVLVFGSYT